MKSRQRMTLLHHHTCKQLFLQNANRADAIFIFVHTTVYRYSHAQQRRNMIGHVGTNIQCAKILVEILVEILFLPRDVSIGQSKVNSAHLKKKKLLLCITQSHNTTNSKLHLCWKDITLICVCVACTCTCVMITLLHRIMQDNMTHLPFFFFLQSLQFVFSQLGQQEHSFCYRSE